MNGDEDSEEHRVLLRYNEDNNLADDRPDKQTINNGNTASDLLLEDGDDDIKSISDTLADKYEAALHSTGFGLFSIFLLTFCGITLLADTTEILCVSFVMPSAEKELCLTDWMKGLIGSIIFVGMLIGGYTWGSLADQIGRRTCLFLSITMNGLFGLASAFVEHPVTFCVLRFLSGVGVGASVPVVFSYFSEFLTQKVRGKLISLMSMFWMFGQITTSMFALIVIPRDINIQIGSFTIHSWRIFVILCTIPAFTSSALSLLMPESPRYLLVKGQKEKSLQVLKLIYRVNKFKPKNTTYPVEIDSLFKFHKPVIQSTSRSLKPLILLALNKIKLVVKSTLHLFSRGLWFRTVVLSIVLFIMSFSTYGITLWFPEYVRNLQQSGRVLIPCENATSIKPGQFGTYSNVAFSECTMDPKFSNNRSFYECSFNKVSFKNGNFKNISLINATLSSVEFNNASFTDLSLQYSTLHTVTWFSVNATNLSLFQIQSERTIIQKSRIFSGSILSSHMNRIDISSSMISNLIINSSEILNIDLDRADDYNSTNLNSTLTFSKDPCPIIFNEDYDHTKLFLESLYFALANLPGNILTVLLIDYIPRKWMLSVVLILSGVSVFTLWQVPTETVSIILLCIFNGVNVISWNIFNVITAEVYPTAIRSTATGFLSILNRMGAITSVNLFAVFITASPAVPILIVAALLGISGLVSLFLPRVEKQSLK